MNFESFDPKEEPIPAEAPIKTEKAGVLKRAAIAATVFASTLGIGGHALDQHIKAKNMEYVLGEFELDFGNKFESMVRNGDVYTITYNSEVFTIPNDSLVKLYNSEEQKKFESAFGNDPSYVKHWLQVNGGQTGSEQVASK